MWIIWIFILAFAGLIIGWFCTKIIWQYPQKRNIFHALKCNSCLNSLKSVYQIPIIGFLLAKGKCSNCKSNIPLYMLIIPIITPLLLILLFLKFHFSVLFFQFSVLSIAGILIFYLDIYHRIIPDIITYPMIIIALVLSFFNNLGFWNAMIGLAFGAGIFILIAFIFRLITKRDGLGGGDIKLIAMIGLSLGFQLTFFTIFLSSVMGVILYAFSKIRHNVLIPFGSFIVLAMFVGIMTGNELIKLYLGIWGIQ
ncbi:MAG TPA: prepilin peptidase [Candidatus Cloacimonetes bacterium]|nr:prepilin peptidase [Candidatus Cloacimonadota bacterium]HHE40705.1 prepilin peptidase [Candidatus Cloacimonadota bacterium]